jgi:hypothetical protein
MSLIVEGLLWAVAVDVKQLDVAVACCCYQLLVAGNLKLIHLQNTRQHGDVGGGTEYFNCACSTGTAKKMPWLGHEDAATIRPKLVCDYLVLEICLLHV